MDAALVQRFATLCGPAASSATVRRVVRTADGLVLVLHDGGRELELGFAAPRGTAWAWMLRGGERAALTAAVARSTPQLVESPLAGWRDPNASPLDAFRLWLLRPGGGAGPWLRLEGTQVTGVHARPGDRVFELQLEQRDNLGRLERLRLVAELFDHAANLQLFDGDDTVVASWHDRAPVAARVVAARASAPQSGHSSPATEPDAAATSLDRMNSVDLCAAAWLALSQSAADELVRGRHHAWRRAIAHAERLIEKLAAESADTDTAARWRQDGELLTANLHRIKRGQSRVTVEDWFENGAQRDIELDPTASAQENIARLFKRARRTARGRDTVAIRRSQAEAQASAARAALAALPADAAWDVVLGAAPEALLAACPRAASSAVPALWTPGGPASTAPEVTRDAPQRPTGPGRAFQLPGGWEVRVGRSNADNDELTHRFAHPNDVWLHASGVPGSHVVLRMQGHDGNPPREVLEVAAALAARFSKAKHAGTVPVIWTRKRYVRKPRGAAPGLAACTHEKTVFAKPALPEGVESDD